jgi:hypothetical protein
MAASAPLYGYEKSALSIASKRRIEIAEMKFSRRAADEISTTNYIYCV